MVVYLAADWTGDKDAIDVIHYWNACNRYGLNFVDIHEKIQSSDESYPCSIEASLCKRMDESSVFVLIVGKETNEIRKGSCQYCQNRRTNYRECWGHHVQNFKSYIDYECDKAVRDRKRIVILYNSVYKYPERCPESVRNIGTHIAMKNYDGSWNYTNIKIAIMNL